MPRQPQPDQTAEDIVMSQLEAEDDDALNALAAQAGPPPDTRRLSESEEDDLYAFEDRLVSSDPDAFARQLMTQGIPPEMAQRMPIFKVHPDWLPLYQQPTQDADRADMLTRAAQFPFRWGLFDDVAEPTPRVEKAERLDRRYQRRHTALQEQMSQTIVMPGGEQGQGAYSQPAEMPPAPEMGMGVTRP